MKEISASKFKEQCLSLLDHVVTPLTLLRNALSWDSTDLTLIWIHQRTRVDEKVALFTLLELAIHATTKS